MEKTAWLIERRDPLAYMTWGDGGWSWTHDVNDATKFADEKSARQVTNRLRVVFEMVVCEHLWPDGW